MSGLDPTVTGALIAGGAALIGFGAAVLSNSATLSANRRMARDQLLWQKKTELYETIESQFSIWFEASAFDEAFAHSLETWSDRLEALDSSVRLYASPNVEQQVRDLRSRIIHLGQVDISDWDLRQAGGKAVREKRLQLGAAMRADLKGTEATPIQQLIGRTMLARLVMYSLNRHVRREQREISRSQE